MIELGNFLEQIQLTDDIIILVGVEVGELSELHSKMLLPLLDEVRIVIRVIFIEKDRFNLDIFSFRLEGIFKIVEHFLCEVNIAPVGFFNSQADLDMVWFEFVVLVMEPPEGG